VHGLIVPHCEIDDRSRHLRRDGNNIGFDS
jgi:hypothetical protein